ncbi:MAG: penicillin-binding protein 2, partial [Deltaproteobacteria bacterium]
MSDYFKDKETSEYKGRVFLMTVFVALTFFALLVRLWYLQVKEGDYYRELAESNRIRTVKSPAPRGVISDRSGVKLADNRPGFDLYLVSEDVTDWQGTKETLERLIDIDSWTIDEKLERSKNRPPFQAVKLKEDLSWEEAVKIEAFKHEMPGVLLEVTPKRNYIFGEATAHLIGYIGEISEKELKDVIGGNLSPG